MENVIHGLSNEAYHHEKPYSDYLSSSSLKLYLKSPKTAKFALDNPFEDKSDALRFGSLFHDCMAALAEGASLREVLDAIAVFEPPTNESRGTPYTATSKPYKDAYDKFIESTKGILVASKDEKELVSAMLDSLLYGSGATSRQVCKLLKWGKPEVSHFIEYEGCKFKWRPDLETKRKIIDYKTIASDDLSERSINNQIARYGYDISAAYYLFFEHERTGIWKQFYWIFVSKQEPHDAVMVDASEWTYKHDDGIVLPQVGAIKMKALVDLHIKCEREQNWPGAEIYIPEADNGMRIMCPTPPPWEINAAADILELNYQ